MSDRGSSSNRTPTLIASFLISAVLAALITLGMTVLIDRYDRPAIVVGPSTPTGLFVHVDGAVATPGVYSLPPNARLVDAVEAAGGLNGDADLASLNLAGRVGDGESIVVERQGAASMDQDRPVSSPESLTPRININTATEAELQLLPGIGPALAARIVESREQEGPFPSIESLARVNGISDAMVLELTPLISVDD